MSNYNETQYDVPVYKSLNELVSLNNYFDKNITIKEIPLEILRDSSMYDLSDPNEINTLNPVELFSNYNYYNYLVYVVYVLLFLIFFILFFTLL